MLKIYGLTTTSRPFEIYYIGNLQKCQFFRFRVLRFLLRCEINILPIAFLSPLYSSHEFIEPIIKLLHWGSLFHSWSVVVFHWILLAAIANDLRSQLVISSSHQNQKAILKNNQMSTEYKNFDMIRCYERIYYRFVFQYVLWKIYIPK